MKRGEDVENIGSRVEMFVDEWLIAGKEGVMLRLNPPVKREVVLTLDQPWEGSASGNFTILQDEKKIRLYYRGNCLGGDGDPRQVTCYAESSDGIHFTRPNLGLYSFAGSKQNNIVWSGLESHNFSPFIDGNPQAADRFKYKAVGGAAPEGSPWNEGFLYALGSEDGIHWKRLHEEALFAGQPFDSHNVVLWDAPRNQYRCYARNWTDDRIRAIHSSVSSDFKQWGPFEPNRYAENIPLEHFYTNATVCCPEAEHMLLSFPMRFVEKRKKVEEHPVEGVSDAVFMSSRDGVHWDRTFREAWSLPGPDRRNWTDRSNMAALGIVHSDPDEFSLYITEHYRWDDYRLRRLTVRRHGFASIRAECEGGWFITHPFVFSGNRLALNYATSAVGSVRIELQDASRTPLEGYSADEMDALYGDDLEGVVRWRNGADVSRLAGKPVRMKAMLHDADLYAFQFKMM